MSLSRALLPASSLRRLRSSRRRGSVVALALTPVALPLLTGLVGASASAQSDPLVLHTTIRGSVEWTQIPIYQPDTAMAYVQPGDRLEVSFDLTTDDFMNSPSLDPRGTGQLINTRGYRIVEGSFRVTIAQTTMGMYSPWPFATGPFFVVRDQDYTVDGFFGSVGTDEDTPWFTDHPDYIGNGINYSHSFNTSVYDTRDIEATQGTWGYFSRVDGSNIIGSFGLEFTGYLGPAMGFSLDSTSVKLKTTDLAWTPQTTTQWGDVGNWVSAPETPATSTPTTAGHAARFASTGPAQTVGVASAVTVQEIAIDGPSAFTFAGAGSFRLQGLGTTASIFVARGSHSIQVPVTMASTWSAIEVAENASLAISSLTTDGPGVTVSKSGDGNLSVASLTNVGHLNVQAGKLSLPQATLPLTSPPTVATVNKLSIGRTSPFQGRRSYYGKIDLGTTDLVVRNTTPAAASATLALVLDAVRSSYGRSGQWDGAWTFGTSPTVYYYGGITSSVARDAVVAGNPIYAVGAMINIAAPGVPYYASFDGVAVSADDVLVKLTYVGDTNLDGVVNGTDLANLIEGLSNGYTGWANGDLNYDGVVTGADYALFQVGLAGQGAPLSGGSVLAGAVPEPASLAVLAALPVLTTRRRRDNR